MRFFKHFLIALLMLVTSKRTHGMHPKTTDKMSDLCEILQDTTITPKKYSNEKSKQLITEMKETHSEECLKIIEELLKGDENGAADPNYADKEGSTSLHHAPYYKKTNIEILKLLLDYNADPNKVDNYNRTPMRWVAFYGNIEMAQALLDKKALLNMGDFRGYTTLLTASSQASSPNHRFIELLLKHNADPNAKTTKNKVTPLHLLAAQSGTDESIKVLLSYGGDPTSKNIDHHTPLTWAAYENQVKNVEVLLNHMDNLLDPKNILKIICAIDSEFKKHALFFLVMIKKLGVKIPKPLLFSLLLLDWIQKNPDHYLSKMAMGNGKQIIKDWVNSLNISYSHRSNNQSIKKLFKPYREK